VGKIINNKNPKLVFIVALFLFLLGILPLLQKCIKVTNNTGIINTNKERNLKINDPTEYLIIFPFIIDDNGNVGFAEITLIRFDASNLLFQGYNVFILLVLGVVSIIFLLAKKK